jgi:hypothetical protein
MAKDRSGRPLEVGDKVLIPGVVSMVFGNADAAEVLVTPDEKALGGFKQNIPLNSRQLDLAAPLAPVPAIESAPVKPPKG